MFRINLGSALAAALMLTASHAAATPWAFEVVDYSAGTGAGAFTDASTSLGAPSTDTGFGDVSLINGPFLTTQLVSVGDGGELVVRFDHQVQDDPGNPFGIDLLVFGNSFFTQPGTGILDGGIFADPGIISVSKTNGNWSVVSGIFADALFPTHAFTDTSAPSGFDNASDGTISSDFLRPVDPSLTTADFNGLAFNAAVALYGGSGGGAGVDLASVGLDWIQYVRITSSGASVEIDAFSDVVAAAPEPAALWLLGLGLAALARAKRA